MKKTENVPRVMIAGANSGSGKTTITCGIIGALISENMRVSSFKCGGDYIDPLFHSEFLGATSSNIDLFLHSENTVNYLLYKNSKSSDISIIEGAMGFYDGLGGVSEEKSAFDISQRTKTPVILVVNCKGMSVSIAAQINGYLQYRENNIKAVILNNISKMLYPKIKEKIENELGIEVVGFLEHNGDIVFGDRKLGLIPLWEQKEKAINKIKVLVEMAKKSLDIEEIKRIANSAQPIVFDDDFQKSFVQAIKNKNAKLKIAVPKDKAFCFCYNDNIDVLKSLGAEIVSF
ncbi:MAG: cobyrinate a,c-diamide synthase, partial [Oscillospiraceae bacterium]